MSTQEIGAEIDKALAILKSLPVSPASPGQRYIAELDTDQIEEVVAVLKWAKRELAAMTDDGLSFDPKKPFMTRDRRLVSGVTGVTPPALAITGAVSGEEMSWVRETGRSWISRNLDLVNIDVDPRAVLPTPAGDMAGKDDAAFVERMAVKEPIDGDYTPDFMHLEMGDFNRLIRIAREGARREPVAGDGWQRALRAAKRLKRYARDGITCALVTANCDEIIDCLDPPKISPPTSLVSPTTTTATPSEEALCHTLPSAASPDRFVSGAEFPIKSCPYPDHSPAVVPPATVEEEIGRQIREGLRAASPNGAGSGSEPEAWQIKDFGGEWITRSGPSAESRCRKEAEDTGALVRPLYAAPPASVDAVAVVTEWWKAQSFKANTAGFACGCSHAVQEIIAALRARQQATEARS